MEGEWRTGLDNAEGWIMTLESHISDMACLLEDCASFLAALSADEFDEEEANSLRERIDSFIGVEPDD